MILGLIPARGGSKGIPRKNLALALDAFARLPAGAARLVVVGKVTYACLPTTTYTGGGGGHRL